jgi:hypothetical protein
VLRPLAAALLALLILAAPAAADRYDVLDLLGDELERVDRATPVPILLPPTLDLDYDGRVFAFGDGRRRAWGFTLTTRRRCGANACYLASLDAERGGELAFARRVRITNTVRGSYKPLSCGASCSPPAIDFVRGGVRYAIQAKLGIGGDRAQRRALVQAARAALRAGPR